MEFAGRVCRVKAVFNNEMESRATFIKLNLWFSDVYFPHMIHHGYNYWCFVTNDVLVKFAGNAIIKLSGKQPIQGKIFSSMEEAQRWIDEIIKA